MALAFIFAGMVAYWQFRKRGIDPDFVIYLLIGAVVGGLLGAKIHYLIIHPSEWPSNFLSGSGLVWFGGLIGALLFTVVITKLAKKPLAVVMDAGAYAVCLGYVFGRIGCFLNGDDYGKPTSLPWGMSFPKGSPPTTAIVQPTQLYESLSFLVIFCLFVWVIGPRVKREGVLIFIYLMFAGVERFLVEFVRTNPVAALGLTQQQFISIFLFIIGAAGTWWFLRHGRPLREPYAAPARVPAAHPAVAAKGSTAKAVNANAARSRKKNRRRR